MAGHWRISRVVSAEPASCPTMPPHDLDVTIDPAASPPVYTFDLVQNGDRFFVDDRVLFTTEEFPFAVSEDSLMSIHHIVTLRDDQLIGTATADGAGPQRGCRYTLTLVGTRE